MDPAVVNQLARHINTPSDSEIALPSSDPNEPPKRLVRPPSLCFSRRERTL